MKETWIHLSTTLGILLYVLVFTQLLSGLLALPVITPFKLTYNVYEVLPVAFFAVWAFAYTILYIQREDVVAQEKPVHYKTNCTISN